ncbi:Asp-tRNA(Asn)/Glu-tRNA(Gln) amidotransferase subunit GatC [Tessaracoccus sp. OH4464_COT-324]|uniref:Asp-tRNA(Asn)/Glu-tRNA(Gln) amidotransferase subunit GatC n=1 Tax=Tessaracoccus sp. OH4464_COT-324 TaxID=2491059 RepID=UPI000F63C739|nr:Asp-tRNA(Asn)/Glu-tRNA(Gln) amidotransferase subunit GatC [Tessaracoccus sp. OH4464_COT-324]RRD47917.1 Asp-tRNA(Asn)/Glu-tRNA(Gln) amidotransferase subunit GatC [Tessaracoccus sp. OH4464_COT-324]
MAVTPEDVARLAGLARIQLSPDECAELAPEIDVILESMAAVGEVARSEVVLTTHAVERTNVFRDDVVRPSLTQAQALSAAPAVEDGRFRVPAILSED